MYIAFKIGKLELVAVTKDENCAATNVVKYKKGFRFKLGGLLWNKGLFKYKNPKEGWVKLCL